MTHRTLLVSALAAIGAWLPNRASATLLDFQNYELGGVSASWDLFYGANYLPVFTFSTGTAGNPILNSLEEISLRATVTSWTAGPPMPSNQQSTGPIGTDNSVPGNREQFYTFFGNVNWDVTHVSNAYWDTVIFQAKVSTGSNTSIASMLFNGLAATSSSFDSGSGVGTWRWDGLNLASGSNYTLTWNTGTHTGLDAYQLQAGVVPEPSTYALMVLAAIVLLVRRVRCASVK